MSAIEECRTGALGGHVMRCENEKCGHTRIAYNSCRNRHCPKCQGAAAREWLEEREKELLPLPYFHVVSFAQSNSLVGTWKLNIEKSKFSGAALRSQTNTYVQDG